MQLSSASENRTATTRRGANEGCHDAFLSNVFRVFIHHLCRRERLSNRGTWSSSSYTPTVQAAAFASAAGALECDAAGRLGSTSNHIAPPIAASAAANTNAATQPNRLAM
jgi:hypothetical protein